jgi:hypothetical protein
MGMDLNRLLWLLSFTRVDEIDLAPTSSVLETGDVFVVVTPCSPAPLRLLSV